MCDQHRNHPTHQQPSIDAHPRLDPDRHAHKHRSLFAVAIHHRPRIQCTPRRRAIHAGYFRDAWPLGKSFMGQLQTNTHASHRSTSGLACIS